jgi:hypothetical protein
MLAVIVSASGDNVPLISVTPKVALKFSVSITLIGAGMHYLTSGRKEASINKMVTGALLALSSLLFI